MSREVLGMNDGPVLEVTFSHIIGNPWVGDVSIRFNGEPTEPITIAEQLTDKELADVRWYVEEFMDFPEGGFESRAKQIERRLEQWGREIWDSFAKSLAVQQWIGSVYATRAGRIELRAATQEDELAFRTPWELMRVGLGATGGELLHQLGVTVVRRVSSNIPRRSVPDATHGLRVLAIVCRPEEAGFLDPRYTPQAMLDALADRPEVSVEFCRPGTLVALTEMLETARTAERPYHVVHFDGHGTTLPREGGIGALCFEDANERMDLVKAEQFGDLMSRFDIPLVVLEACRTAKKSFAQETVASSLLRHGVGTVVAMGHAVHVDMTRELMSAFYSAIARGQSLGEALQSGRVRLAARPQRRTRIVPDAPVVKLQDWFVPQLFQGGTDPTLLSVGFRSAKGRSVKSDSTADDSSSESDATATERAFAERKPTLHHFPPPPRAGFHGRGLQLHRLERKIAKHRAVVVHAPGGMGKTTIATEAAAWWVRTGLFPDGAIFISLEHNPSLPRVISEVGEVLEGIEFHKRDEQSARDYIAERLQRERWLIVWDNFESVLPSFRSRPVEHVSNVLNQPQQGHVENVPHAGAVESQSDSTTKPRVFLSHSSADKPSVEYLARRLRERGIEVWFDKEQMLVGDRITPSLEDGLKSCDQLILVWSEKAASSTWVEFEWQQLLPLEEQAQRPLILPVRVDNAALPSELSDKRFLDLFPQFEAALNELERAIRRSHVEHVSNVLDQAQPRHVENVPHVGAVESRSDSTTAFAELAAEWTTKRSRVLITSRDGEIGFRSDVAWPFELSELSPHEGMALLVGYLERLGIDRYQRDQRGWSVEVLEPIVTKTLGHPLSLELLTPHIKSLGPEKVIEVLDELLPTAQQAHGEGRNRSLRASLEFSIRHLSDEAQAALPAVSLVSGGFLEDMTQMIADLDDAAWQRVRSELERTGLLRVEGPIVKPHPVLDLGLARVTDPSRLARPEQREGRGNASHEHPKDHALPDGQSVPPSQDRPTQPQTNAVLRDRFIAVVKQFCIEFDKHVRGPQSKFALGLMRLCEVTVRRAIDAALDAGQNQPAWAMCDSLKQFLGLSGRGGEGAVLMTQLHERVVGTDSDESRLSLRERASFEPDVRADAADDGTCSRTHFRGAKGETELDETTATIIREAAWAKAARNPAAALTDLRQLLAQLEAITTWDTRFERAITNQWLGRVAYDIIRRSADALAPLHAAVELFAELERDRGQDSTNRAATLGDLANVHRDLGDFPAALQAAEDAIALNRARHDQSSVARGEGQIAQILHAQGQHTQAEARYHAALQAAEQSGDDEALAILWQGLGALNRERQRPERAIDSLRRAFDAFGRAHDSAGQMRVLNSLGNVEQNRGEHAAAVSWFERSLALAKQLNDIQGQATARSNRAVCYKQQSEFAADPDTARRLLQLSISEERAALELHEQLGQPADIAISHNNLANRLRMAGDLTEAEAHAQQALAIRTRLNDHRIGSTLGILELIATARGDHSAAADYRTRKEAAIAEGQRRAGLPSLPDELIEQLLQLALTARARGDSFQLALSAAGAPPEFLDQIEPMAPWLIPHLTALATHQPRPTTVVPPPLRELINAAWQAAEN